MNESGIPKRAVTTPLRVGAPSSETCAVSMSSPRPSPATVCSNPLRVLMSS
jgi:hypothetical protein